MFMFALMSVKRAVVSLEACVHCGDLVRIHFRTHVCVQGGHLARLSSLGSLGAPSALWIMFVCECLCVCVSACADDFLNLFGKSVLQVACLKAYDQGEFKHFP